MTALIITIFCLGYLGIALEQFIRINKAAIALLTAVFCWTAFILMSPDKSAVSAQLIEHVGDFSGILFFLMGAMTIVELIDAHRGFDLITERIHIDGKRRLLWLTGSIAFFLSAVLDNLTTTIVMISLLMKFSLSKEERLTFIGMVVIAANAGGAWSPIGDVTTTMLWIGNRITSGGIIAKVLLPSLVCAIVPLALVSMRIHGKLESHAHVVRKNIDKKQLRIRNAVFFVGVFALLFVPIFKTLTHLPPFMGMLLALGVLWVFTELLYAKREEEEKRPFSVAEALGNIDMPSVLFFLGILASIAALEAAGVLHHLAGWLDTNIRNATAIDLCVGFLSSVVDNVPLVAGMMGIYDLHRYAVDHHFWIFLSYCAGTGGSVLIIGSAAGVAAMGVANVPFLWYLRKISLLAIAGYLAGAGFYLLQQLIIH
jgi:Na+/H+ antiporter NhaD/arsenite permease-like protein